MGFRFAVFAAVASIVICIWTLLVEVSRKRKKRDFLVATLVRRVNFNIIAGFIYLFISLYYINSFVKHLNKTYELIGREYITDKYLLVNEAFVDGLRQLFFEEQMLSKLYRIVSYQSYDMHKLPLSIVFLCAALLYLYRGFSKGRIYRDCIVTGAENISIESIKGFKWEGIKRKKPLLQIEFYDLEITRPISKIDRWFSGDMATGKAVLRVDCADRDKVDSFLESVLRKEDGRENISEEPS